MQMTSIDVALETLPASTAFILANGARPADTYFFAQLLPERNEYSYHVDQATMTVRATMAGLVGMDSPYPPTGIVEARAFSENTAKIANRVRMTERLIRKIQDHVMRLQLTQQPTVPYLVNTILLFMNKMIVQGHLDTMEFLRGRAITDGVIDWTFNNKRLYVDYGIPAENKLPTRTGADAYDGTNSQFWPDVTKQRQILKNNVRVFAAHPDTINLILGNPANRLDVIGGDGQTTFQIVRVVGNNETASKDIRENITLVAYGLEAETIDPENPQATVKIPFLRRGKLVAVGNNQAQTFDTGINAVGVGTTLVPTNALGYTHIAPTTEGNGTPGRFAAMYRPERELWSLEGVGVTNGLPVIEAPEKIAIATTAMPA